MEEKLKEQKNRKDYWLHEVKAYRISEKNLFIPLLRASLLK